MEILFFDMVDARNLFLTVGTFSGGTSTVTPLAAYTYDPLGRRVNRDLTDGGVIKRSVYAYDLANQLSPLTNQIAGGALISKFTYTYNNISNRLSQSAQTPSGTKTINFTYNKIEELTGTTGSQAHTYTYDLVSNRTASDGINYVPNNLNNYIKGKQWAGQNPLTTHNYAQKYGLPAQNSKTPDWIVKGSYSGSFKTRVAPQGYNNSLNKGGSQEITPKNPNEVQLRWFHMPD